jgi:methionine-rich copper-binding protein CopC
LAHAKVDHCLPATGGTSASAPTEARCWFTEELDTKQSTLTVTNSKNERVDNGDAKVDLNDKDHVQLFATLKPSLPQDVYKVSWHAVTPGDLGITDGEFYFGIGTVTVPQNDPNTLAPAAATNPGSNTVPDTTRTYIAAALVLAAAAGIAYVARRVIR